MEWWGVRLKILRSCDKYYYCWFIQSVRLQGNPFAKIVDVCFTSFLCRHMFTPFYDGYTLCALTMVTINEVERLLSEYSCNL